MKQFLSFSMAIWLCILMMASCSATEFPAAGGTEMGQLTSNSVQTTGFSDIPADMWCADAAAYCRQHGIMSGISDDTFAPEAPLTRAMLAVILYRMRNTPAVSDPPAFSDVAAGAWYSDAVSWAVKSGIISGYGGGTFGANDPTTREQAVTILWRYAGSPESAAAETVFDMASISGWAQAAVRWAGAAGILEGMTENGRFDPKTNIKRGEAASMLYHYLERATRLPEDSSAAKLVVSFNGHTYSASLADNSSAKAFAELLREGPLTISTRDYGGFEKVGALGTDLPRNDGQITTAAGDIILYQGNQITLYYAQNTWSFTRLGWLDDPSGLQEALGNGAVEITFALAEEQSSAGNSGGV